MLKFIVFNNNQAVDDIDLSGSYLIGQDEVPVRGKIEFRDGVITCQKNTEDAVGLAIMWNIPRAGKFLLQTTRLPDRNKPYILNVELARWRLMRILQKMEDWGLFLYPQTEHIKDLFGRARKLFIQALQNLDIPEQAAKFADNALELAIETGEELAKFYAQKMLISRIQNGVLSRKIFGINIDTRIPIDQLPGDVLSTFNFAKIPICWAELEPAKGRFDYAKLDKWFEFFVQRKVTIRLGAVVDFNPEKIPAWLRGIKDISFEQIRDEIHSYLSNISKRYGKFIRSWTVLSGIHSSNPFNLNFEQILDLTRSCCAWAKQLCPRASAIIEIDYPWGEYSAVNPRTIPPFLYAEMTAQSGINFDAFGLRMLFGSSSKCLCMRDFFQISAIIDRYAILGMPIHLITAAPSIGNDETNSKLGYWENPWSPELQASWFERFAHIALSKIAVDSITWNTLSDEFSGDIPDSGIFNPNWISKPIFARIRAVQKQLTEAKMRYRAEPD